MNKKYLVIITLIVFIAGFKMFYDSKTIETLNKSLIEKELKRELLNKQLKKQELISDSLIKVNEKLYNEWLNRSSVKTIEKIKIKYEKSKLDIINSNSDKQFIIFTNWLPKENSN